MNAPDLLCWLLELNVINAKDIDRQLDKIAARVNNEQAAKWFKRIARHFIVNINLLRDTPYTIKHKKKERLLPGYKDEVAAEIERNFQPYSWKARKKFTYGEAPQPDELTKDQPCTRCNGTGKNSAGAGCASCGGTGQKKPWTAAAKEQGEQLHYFNPIQPSRRLLWQQLSTTADWFNSLPANSEVFGLLQGQSYDDVDGFRNIIRRATKWKKDTEANPWRYVRDNTQTVIEFPGGSKLVRLMTPADLAKEGVYMNHCVGGQGYQQQMTNGTTQFYSLRNHNNRPNVTMSLALPNSLVAIKGPNNITNTIKPHYKALLRQAIQQLGWVVTGDQASVRD